MFNLTKLSLVIVIAILALSCAKAEPTKPGQARNCEELVQIGRDVAELVLDQIEEKELNENQPSIRSGLKSNHKNRKDKV